MLLLALDTAGPACSVALARPADDVPEILAGAEERIGRGHAERLMPMIEAALAEAGFSFSDIGRIAVTVGPGSFTGVRVGVAAARGLALALDIPAVGIGSLEALAWPLVRSRRKGTAVAVLDARRGEVFAFAQDMQTEAIVMSSAAVRVEALPMRLAELRRPLVVTGAGTPLIANSLSDIEIAATNESPDIADVAALGLRASATTPPVPLYARGADAKPQIMGAPLL
jgi:tRNA threonylcarbamoyladenosine biosynthesis protein TsaB